MDRRGRGLTLKARADVDFNRTLTERRELAHGGASEAVRRDAELAHAVVERRGAAADREAHQRAGDRQVVAVADFDGGLHGGLLVDHVHRVFALEDDDAQSSLRGKAWQPGMGGCGDQRKRGDQCEAVTTPAATLRRVSGHGAPRSGAMQHKPIHYLWTSSIVVATSFASLSRFTT